MMTRLLQVGFLVCLFCSVGAQLTVSSCWDCPWTDTDHQYLVSGQCKLACSPRTKYPTIIPCKCNNGSLFDIDFVETAIGNVLEAYLYQRNDKYQTWSINVGANVDIGVYPTTYKGQESMIGLGVTDRALLKKLFPNLGLTGAVAKGYFVPFTLTPAEARLLNLAVKTRLARKFAKRYNIDNKNNLVFEQLTCAARSTLVSLYDDFGDKLFTEPVYLAALEGNWQKVIDSLRYLSPCNCQRSFLEIDILTNTPSECPLVLPPDPLKIRPTICILKDFETLYQSYKSCEKADVLTACAVHTALIQVSAPQFYGLSIVIDPSFEQVIEKVNMYAAECFVKLIVLDSFPSKKMANVNLGRSVRFRITATEGICDDACLALPLAQQPSDVQCFMNKMKADTGLKLLTGNNIFTDILPLNSTNDETMMMAKKYSSACIKNVVIEGETVEPIKKVAIPPPPPLKPNITGSCPVQAMSCDYLTCRDNALNCGAQGAFQSVSPSCAKLLSSSEFAKLDVDGQKFANRSMLCIQLGLQQLNSSLKCANISDALTTSIFPDCILSSGLCSIVATNFDVIQGAFSSSPHWAALCKQIESCMLPSTLQDHINGFCPKYEQQKSGVLAYYSGITIPYAVPIPSSSNEAEYTTPFPTEKWIPPLLDTCTPASCCSTSCPSGTPAEFVSAHFRVSDLLSSFDAKLSTHRVKFEVNGTAMTRNRFFRAHPRAIRCLEHVRSAMKSELKILDFYRTASEAKALGLTVPSRFQTGGAARITVEGTAAKGRLQDLVVAVVQQCLPIFREIGQGMRVGLLADSVQFEMLPEDKLDGFVKGNKAMETNDFVTWIRTIADQTRLRVRYYNCTHPVVAPSQQSPTFQRNALKDFRRALSDTVSSTFESTKSFCNASFQAREDQFKSLLGKIERQHKASKSQKLRPLEDIRAALVGCFLTCNSTSIFKDVKNFFSGQMTSFDRKVEACDNLIHWLPFGFGKTNGSCHFYSTSTKRMRDNACFFGQCMDKTPLYSMLSEHFDATFVRPLESNGTEAHSDPEPLFSFSKNPTPIYSLIQKLYAMHCAGKATVWVSHEGELNALRLVMEILMGYNKDITYVELKTNEAAYFDVVDTIENYIEDWKESLCRSVSRDYLAPVVISKIGDSISKAK